MFYFFSINHLDKAICLWKLNLKLIIKEYQNIKLEDTISLCSIVNLDSNLISILNDFEKREYIFFQKASIVLREDSARVERAELEFYKDKNNYNSIIFDKINYKISLSLVNSGIKIESKAVKTSYKNFVPEFFVQDGELVYNSITVYKTNVITGLTVP